MRPLLWATVVSLIAVAPAYSGTDPSACRILSGPTDSAANGTRSFSRSLEDTDLEAARSYLSGPELDAFNEMIEARNRAMGPMRAFADRLEDFAYALRRCAR